MSVENRPSLYGRYVAFVSRHAWLVMAAGLLVFVGSAALARKLELKTAFSEMLPSEDPGVVALRKTQARMGDLNLLLVGVRSPDKAANLRYAEAVTQRLRLLPPKICELATYHLRDLRGFFEANKWLYVSEPDLESIRDRLRREIAKRKNPLALSLSDDEDESVEAMRKRIGGKSELEERFPDAVFSNKDGTYVWIAALTPSGQFGERAGEGLLGEARRILKEVDPKAFHPALEAYLGGPVSTLLATREAVERDILWVTLTCLGVVALSIVLFFRRKRAVPLIGAPAVLGTVMAFAVAELAFGYVNSSTAFLGSIILGNGINYAIILISRYLEERAADQSAQPALERALRGVVKGTLIAALCASGAYATLLLTSFRGFFQFGVMGASGVLFCWIATFTLLPAMLLIIDRRAPAHETRRPPVSFGQFGRLLGRHAPLVLVASVVLTVASAFGLGHFAGTPFEYDFRKLNTRLDRTQSAEDFSTSQERLFGRWPNPTVILADRIEEIEAMRQAIRRQDAIFPGPNVIDRIVTVFDVLPGHAADQERKLALIRQIHKLAHDPLLETLTPEERKDLDKLDVPADLRVLEPKDLPPLVRRLFTEVDGTVGRVMLVYPPERGISVWNGRDLLRIASVLQHLELPEQGKTVDTSGREVVFAGMLRSILRDGPVATIASLGLVLLVGLFVMRPFRAAALALVSLLVGVLWMVGAAGFAEVKITFVNFIALPITFGIGVEYALNVVVRDRENRDMMRAVATTGGAVFLCSWTTIVGYGSLLAARNRALQGFGAMAILGEVACLVAAIVAMPAAVLWWRRLRARPSAAVQPTT